MIPMLWLIWQRWVDWTSWALSGPRPRRWATVAGVTVIPFVVGLAIGQVAGAPGALVVMLVMLPVLAVIATGFPPPTLPWESWGPQTPATGGGGPVPCALCGYNCAGGGFNTPVPGDQTYYVHTMGCGPNLPGEQRLAEPTHWRHPEAGIVRY